MAALGERHLCRLPALDHSYCADGVGTVHERARSVDRCRAWSCAMLRWRMSGLDRDLPALRREALALHRQPLAEFLRDLSRPLSLHNLAAIYPASRPIVRSRKGRDRIHRYLDAELGHQRCHLSRSHRCATGRSKSLTAGSTAMSGRAELLLL